MYIAVHIFLNVSQFTGIKGDYLWNNDKKKKKEKLSKSQSSHL